jgi:DNA-binding SARP family transcriptional activator
MTAPVEKPSFEFGVLGPVAFRRDGQHLRIAAVPRRLLGLLLAHGDQYVAADVIVEEMWPGDPAIRGRPRLQVNVSRLRQLLDDADRITYRSGYAIRLQPDELDSVVFERLIAESAQAAARGDPSTARACLRDAVSLWRGAAYDGLLDMPSVARTAARLEHLRLDAIEQAIQLDLDAGQHSAVIAELSILIPQHPYRERMRGQHMLALYRSGRQADALDAYRQTYQVLSDDLGVEPVPELQALHQHILAGDPSLDGRSREAVASHYQAPELVRPQLLPRPVANFIGRSEQLASLDANARGDHSTGTAGILSVITGSAGVGKRH